MIYLREVGEAYLQYGKLMHLLASASWDHILQHPELLIHLRASPPLYEAMRRLSGDLSASSSGTRVVPPSPIARLSCTLRLRRALLRRHCRLALRTAFPRLHLDDLARSCRRRRQSEIIFRDHRGSLRRRSFLREA